MSKEQLEELKNELREELKREFKEELENNKRSDIWTIYCKEYIIPKLEEKTTDSRRIHQLRDALNAIARVSLNKRHVCRITESELEGIKPLINNILNEIKIKKEETN